jgi:Cytochrome b5-like Heme/Steroid binding domain/F-box domain
MVPVDFAIGWALGLQILMLGVLVAITIYRKEMSCNRCYAAEQNEERTTATRSSARIETIVTTAEERAATVPVSRSMQQGREWDHRQTETLLEGAGCYYYTSLGTTTYSLLWQTVQIPLHRTLASLSSWWVVAAQDQRFDEILDVAADKPWCCCIGNPLQPPVAVVVVSANKGDANAHKMSNAHLLFPAAPGLPFDSILHIVSFLHPRDVVSLASTSEQLRRVLDDDDERSECSASIWRSLWYRDYAWLVLSWNVGRSALKRSLQQMADVSKEGPLSLLADVHFSKSFYFRFGLSWLDYVIAGQCMVDQCLIGLGGHIYDLTTFLPQHPGSPETVVAHAGRDATCAFESMRHTSAARQLAQKCCLIVSSSLKQSHAGVRPTAVLLPELLTDESQGHFVPPPVPQHTPPGISQVPTLKSVWDDFIVEKKSAKEQARRRLANLDDAVLGEVHVFHDPFRGAWDAWYIDSTLQADFVNDLPI